MFDIKALEKRAASIASRLGDPELLMDIVSELFLLSQDKDLKKYSDKELGTIIAKSLHLNVKFQEINESQTIKNEDDEELPSLLEMQSDGITAETIMVEREEAPLIAEVEEIIEANRMQLFNKHAVEVTSQQEDIFLLRKILGYKFKEIYSLTGLNPAVVWRELQALSVQEDMSIFDKPIVLNSLEIDWL
jgi:hypothetical protein